MNWPANSPDGSIIEYNQKHYCLTNVSILFNCRITNFSYGKVKDQSQIIAWSFGLLHTRTMTSHVQHCRNNYHRVTCLSINTDFHHRCYQASVWYRRSYNYNSYTIDIGCKYFTRHLLTNNRSIGNVWNTVERRVASITRTWITRNVSYPNRFMYVLYKEKYVILKAIVHTFKIANLASFYQT